MPKEKNQHKSAAASDEKFRDFFTTTVADIPAEMVRREEEAAEEHKGLFGRLFGHAKPKQAPQAGTDLELPTGVVPGTTRTETVVNEVEETVIVLGTSQPT